MSCDLSRYKKCSNSATRSQYLHVWQTRKEDPTRQRVWSCKASLYSPVKYLRYRKIIRHLGLASDWKPIVLLCESAVK